MLFVRDYLLDQSVMRCAGAPECPLVSVVLPTHARGKNGMLRRSIGSVLSQTMKDFELLVIDDGSSDGSFELIEEFRRDDPRVVHVRHERNSGIHSIRLNEGIAAARGKHIAFQFDDDYWHAHALEALSNELIRQNEPTVVVGRAEFSGRGTTWVLPSVELNMVSLYEQNRIANNAVLLPRVLMDELGMYDCHIGMRRLCDWDLWLRLMKHVPFRLVDSVISSVYESNPGSLGVTVPWDLSLFRYLNSIERGRLLRPDDWQDYEVDSLAIGGIPLETDMRRRLYEDQIAPYYMKFRHHFPTLGEFPATLPRRAKTALLTKQTYDVSNDVTLNHYDDLSSRRGNFKAYFQPLSQVPSRWAQEADQLLLVRTVEDRAKTLLQEALDAGKPAGLYLDDDLLAFHEYGPQYDYIAPGTPYHQNLSVLLSGVDTVWVTTEPIRLAVSEHNPRVIPHTNCVPAAWLPDSVRSRQSNEPWRIGYVGSDYRIEEFRELWDGLLSLSKEYRERLAFEFWGLDVRSLPRLSSPVVQRPYTFSYFYYLRQLKNAAFDILLCPLLDRPRPRLAKSLIKYSEAAIAGALAIFSDVPQYRQLPLGLTCLKASNDADAWRAAISEALAMPAELFDLMRRRALEHVREEFTETANIQLYEAAWRATEFHAKTRKYRHADGKPRVLYVFHSIYFGGGETVLWRKMMLARRYGIEPVAVFPRAQESTEAARILRDRLARERIDAEFADYICFDVPRAPAEFRSEAQLAEVKVLLERYRPGVVHTTAFNPSFGQACAEAGVPHVASFYAIEDSFEWDGGTPTFRHCEVIQSDTVRYAKRWGELLGSETVCSREMVPESVFDFGRERYLRSIGTKAEKRDRFVLVLAGTFQPRKRQLETIAAVGRLRREGWDCRLRLFGYTHFFRAYVAACRQRVREMNLEEFVTFHEFDEDMTRVLNGADIVVSVSTYESLPTVIKEAMAAGILVVATPVGGIPEIIIDGVSGICCDGISEDALADGIRRAIRLEPEHREGIVRHGRFVARSEFHPQRIASDMFAIYDNAIEIARERMSENAPTETAKPASGSSLRQGFVANPALPPAGHLPVRRGLSYIVQPQRDWLSGITVMVGTNNRPARGKLRLAVETADGVTLRKSEADLATVADNSLVQFRFSPIEHSRGSHFTLRFTVRQSDSFTQVSLYEMVPPADRLARWSHRVGVLAARDSLYCYLHFRDPAMEKAVRQELLGA